MGIWELATHPGLTTHCAEYRKCWTLWESRQSTCFSARWPSCSSRLGSTRRRYSTWTRILLHCSQRLPPSLPSQNIRMCRHRRQSPNSTCRWWWLWVVLFCCTSHHHFPWRSTSQHRACNATNQKFCDISTVLEARGARKPLIFILDSSSMHVISANFAKPFLLYFSTTTFNGFLVLTSTATRHPDDSLASKRDARSSVTVYSFRCMKRWTRRCPID